LLPETSNNKFRRSSGFIVKLSPLIDDNIFTYIIHDLLFELKLCKLIIKLYNIIKSKIHTHSGKLLLIIFFKVNISNSKYN